ncbi:MAG: hypothetical protein KAT70_02710 [Thermoplasmata archaeon]|nr:hypothetical protein [Thermoplasmata archaeon]
MEENSGKWYFEKGDVISMLVDMDSSHLSHFKNARAIHGRISSGDFVLTISGSFTDADLPELMDALRESIGGR